MRKIMTFILFYFPFYTFFIFWGQQKRGFFSYVSSIAIRNSNLRSSLESKKVMRGVDFRLLNGLFSPIKVKRCGSNVFQVYFDDVKDSSQESRVKQVSRIKESFNQESRFKWRFKRTLKICKNLKKSIKISIKRFFQKKRLNNTICPKEFFKEKSFTRVFTLS